jgi:UDP-N-acetylglucosamine 2-epimerase (non-hydrolysing)
MKVMTILGTRPDIIKLAMVMQELDKYTDHVIVHTGQNYDYELNEIFYKDLGLRKPDYFLSAVGDNLAQTIGNIIIKADEVMEKEKPDAVLFYGDTNSTLAVIPAKRRKIPVFHMEAGNRCFDQRVPEELNRKVIDHLSDINMVNSELARNYLVREGVRPETVIKTGSPMKELLDKFGERIENSDVLNRLGLKKGEYFVVSAHREENVDSEVNFKSLCDSLNLLVKEYKKPIIFSVHPRTKKRIDDSRIDFDKLIQFCKPFGFLDYLKLQTNALCVLSDSGTITEESSILGFPAITMRNAHERPEGMDEGTVIMSGLKPERILDAVKVTVDQYKSKRPFKIVKDYDVDNVSKKVVKIILSYTDYVNREVWKKL